MLGDIQPIDEADVTLDDFNRVLTVHLHLVDEVGYITVLQINGEEGARIGILPEQIQNMIPVYLPMILNG